MFGAEPFWVCSWGLWQVSCLDAGPAFSNGFAYLGLHPGFSLLPGYQNSHRAFLLEDGCQIAAEGNMSGDLLFCHLAGGTPPLFPAVLLVVLYLV